MPDGSRKTPKNRAKKISQSPTGKTPSGLLAALLLAALVGCGPATPTESYVASDESSPAATPSATELPAGADPADPATNTRETWDVIQMDGVQIGTTQTSETRETSPGQSHVTTVSRMNMSVHRREQEIKTEQTAVTVEDESGGVVRFEARISSGTSTIRVQGTRRGDHWEVHTESAGRVVTNRLPYDPSLTGFFATEQTLRRNPMKPGESRSQRMLFPGLSGVDVASNLIEAIETEPTRLLDGTQTLLKIRSTTTVGDQSLTSFLWVDTEGQVLKSEVPQLFTTYRVDRSTAVKGRSAAPFDLADATAVRIARGLPAGHKTQQASYRVRLKAGSPADSFASQGAQTVEELDDRTARITVRAVRPDSPPAGKPETPPVGADLAPNSLIQSDDPRVVKMAQQVADGESDPWRIAVALESHVRRSMRRVDLSSAMASAGDVARTLSGDCTEHAVLLAALCRARDIPARVATGLIYLDRPAPAFDFHMWTEVWIADRWISLDATLALGGIGAGHLKLADSNLASSNELSVVLAVLPVLRQLEIELMEAE